ncbi:MAG: hypothetical protein IJ466_09795 [Clostridia bacterium]|nr:hypothetical protein [Clostridia bacterium]
MKKILAMVLSLALVATLAISGTVAYLTDDESAVNTMTVGKVDIVLHEEQRNADGSALVDFVQNKNLMPIVGSAQDPKDDWGMPAEINAKNYVDKIVRVENKGESPAWVRIFVAVPSALEAIDGDASKNALHWNLGNRFDELGSGSYNDSDSESPYYDDFAGQPTVVAENFSIDNIPYNIYCFTRSTPLPAENDINTTRTDNWTAAAFVGFYLDDDVDYCDELDREGYYLGDKNVDANKIDFNFENEVHIPVFAQAIQADGFDTSDAAFANMPSNPWANGSMNSDPTAGGTNVSTDEELIKALSEDKQNIIVNLTNDVTYKVGPWSDFPMGGDTTDTITINGNGHTLSFYNTDSDWDHINTASDAKLILNNVDLKNSGNNTGHWKRILTHFNCEVELNNVTATGVGFKKNATLNNVTVSPNGDNYSVWIWAEGNTVNINGLTVTGGRGIKIADEDATNAKVTLSVKNASFTTSSKAAILVTSSTGADITLNRVDISDVSADNINAVWVDEDRAAYAELVTVTGGTCKVEGT